MDFGIEAGRAGKECGIMKMESVRVKDNLGRDVILRAAKEEDAGELIRFMKAAAEETEFLIREPGEFQMSLEEERQFIRSCTENPGALMLLGIVDNCHVGNCSVMGVGPYRRYGHRCQMAVALYKEYWGAGIGKLMMEKALSAAEAMGYEQAELEVVSHNTGAVRLYRKLGFQEYGRFPRNMKYRDGRYADACWMMKQLRKEGAGEA